jgi:glycosyltransferase involved in cell wall biosynthesis
LLLIGIDVTSALASQTGVGVCVRELVHAMLSSSNGGNTFRLCAVSARRDSLPRLRRAFPNEQVKFKIRRLPMRLAQPLADFAPLLSLEAMFGSMDVFHANHLMVPAPRRTATLVSVYDLTPLRFPEFHLASNRFTARQLRRWTDRADRVIVNSQATSQDLQDLAGVDATRIRVVPLGVRACFRKLPVEEDAGGLLRELGLDRDYILAVGALEPRKNLPRLLKAFHILRENYRIPHVLALAGPAGWSSDGILEAIRELRLEQAVRVTGFVEDRILNILYNRASVLVYPTLYEGFGLPPLEAMAAGCPVAVSNSSSIPEVVGDAGLYFDPEKPEEIASAVYRILDSPELRRRLVQSGLQRAQDFAWQKSAERVLAVYCEAREEKSRRAIP